ncbi:polysaccharide deacetylase family protein [Candidatus Azambacteria bacterium]|nr:polysaccharide deacetylase family protein [Candidatus Azambacteria bacterium]
MRWLYWGLALLVVLAAGGYAVRQAVFVSPKSPNPSFAPEPLPTAPQEETRPAVFLTFDAGGNNGGVAKIRDVLRSEKIPATFFLTGRFMERYPEDAKTLLELGPIGNHTYSHLHLAQLAFASATAQILKTEEVAASLGLSLKPYFRFPYGESTPELMKFIEENGYKAYGWTVDTAGWRGTSAGETIENIRERVKKKLAPDAIILMHLGSNPQDKSTLDADALPFLIDDIRAAGYIFKAL